MASMNQLVGLLTLSLLALCSSATFIGLECDLSESRLHPKVILREYDIQSGTENDLWILNDTDISTTNGAAWIPGTTKIVFFAPQYQKVKIVDYSNGNVKNIDIPLFPVAAFSSTHYDAKSQAFYIVFPAQIYEVNLGSGGQRLVANFSGLSSEYRLQYSVLDKANGRIIVFWGEFLHPSDVYIVEIASGKVFRHGPSPIPASFFILTSAWIESSSNISLITMSSAVNPDYMAGEYAIDKGYFEANGFDGLPRRGFIVGMSNWHFDQLGFVTLLDRDSLIVVEIKTNRVLLIMPTSPRRWWESLVKIEK